MEKRRNQTNQRKEKSQNTDITDRSLRLRIIAFVAALLVAVGAITYGVVGIGSKEEGYYEVSESADEEAVLYGSGIALNYYFTGSSSEIKAEMKQVEEVYSSALKRAYKLLDPVNTYAGFNNIAVLNDNPGKEIEVSEELADILKDAWEKTMEGRGYNMFAGALYDHWNSILILEDASVFDPLVNEEEAKRIALLSEETGDISNFTLTFSDGNQVRLDVSEEYVSFCEAQEETDNYLNLNLLHDAYMLNIVTAQLEKSGFTKGYLTTDSGLTVALSGMEESEYCFYGLYNGSVAQVYALTAAPGSACSTFRQFAFREDEDSYYTLDKDGKTYYRSPYVMTGEAGFGNVVMSSCVATQEQDMVGAVYTNILLNSAESAEAIGELSIDNEKYVYAYTLCGEETPRVYLGGE